MKIVIDIPDYDVELIKEYYEGHNIVESTYSYIYHGQPLSEVLDEIKAEIRSKHFRIVEKNDFDNGRTYGYDECLSILDNIGKAESEDI